MMTSIIKLSVCIPTYNRSSKLHRALSAWRDAFNDYGRDDIELIVSDNCSTDNTPLVIQEFEDIRCFRHYRNSENIGFNRNMFQLVDKYAQGEFCWVIGDDDYVDRNCLSCVRELLLEDIDYVSINFRKFANLEVYDRSCRSNGIIKVYTNVSFYKAIDTNVSLDNLLATLMSTSVFRRLPFTKSSRMGIFNDSTYNYMSTFPNSYLMLLLFNKSKASCVNSPLFSVVDEKKEWSNLADLYFKKHLFQLYDYYCSVVGEDVMQDSKNGVWMKKLNAKYIVRDQLLKGIINLKTIRALFLLLSTPQLYVNVLKHRLNM